MSIEQEHALLPCPFCGGKPYFERHGTSRQSCQIACGDCGASLETGEEGGHCGKAWNRRAALQSQDLEDAKRYRWLLGKFQQSYDGEDFEAYSISIYSRMASQFKGERTVRTDITWRDKTDEPIGLSEAIDHARRVEEMGNE